MYSEAAQRSANTCGNPFCQHPLLFQSVIACRINCLHGLITRHLDHARTVSTELAKSSIKRQLLVQYLSVSILESSWVKTKVNPLTLAVEVVAAHPLALLKMGTPIRPPNTDRLRSTTGSEGHSQGTKAPPRAEIDS